MIAMHLVTEAITAYCKSDSSLLFSFIEKSLDDTFTENDARTDRY